MSDDQKVEELQSKIGDLADELRLHAEEVEDPKCAALCETSAEVLSGLGVAFGHYLDKSETAWE